MMTSRERLLTAIRHQEPDTVPVSPRIWAWLLEHYGAAGWKEDLKAAHEYDYDPIIVISPGILNYIAAGILSQSACRALPEVEICQEITENQSIFEVRRTYETPAGKLTDMMKVLPAGAEFGIAPNPEIIEPLLKSREDIAKIKFLLPSPGTGCYAEIRKITARVGEKGLVATRSLSGSDQLTIDAFGITNAMLASMDDPGLLQDVFAVFHQYNLAITQKCLEAGAEMVFDSGYNMSLSTGWSPLQWREFFLPNVREMCNLTHQYDALYFYYDDGRMMGILPYLYGLGVDIVETCTLPPIGDFDMAAAKKNYGDRLCFKGVIDTVEDIRFGNPAKIQKRVAEAVEILAPGGGFILGTSDSIRDQSPDENVKAFFQAGRELGKYE